MRLYSGNIRSEKHLSDDERQRVAAADARYVCRWIVQANKWQTHSIPQNIVDLAKRAIQ